MSSTPAQSEDQPSVTIVNQVEELQINSVAGESDRQHHHHHHHHGHHTHHLLHKYSTSRHSHDDDDDGHDESCYSRTPVTCGPSPAVDRKHGLARLLKNNRQWSKAIRERQPDFFEKCSLGQQPKVFWIGCSDSRVPENELLQLAPGEVFTHRNIANVVISTDLNCLSVLQYAVEVLKVEQVVVCGHYGCGGVAAALGDHSYGLIDHWLANIKEVKQQHQQSIDNIKDEEEKCRALVEMNCRNSVLTVSKSPIMKSAWARGQKVDVVGVVYDIKTGLLSELGYHVAGPEDLAYQLQIDSDALFAARKATELQI
ncbi:hypothetical protein BGZ76_000166 [Entomortierella beljakovae]|nr:hypothetical protein BGZ76_000166 [Entomortierella beljakovae]